MSYATQAVIEIPGFQGCYDTFRYETASERPVGKRLQRLIDSGSLPIPHDLTSTQLYTLGAIFVLLAQRGLDRDAASHHIKSIAVSGHTSHSYPHTIDYRLGLDEIDAIARTRAGYAFTELAPELQEAVLCLILTHDLASDRLDLALWLKAVQLTTTANIL